MTLRRYIRTDWHDTVSCSWYCDLTSCDLSKWNSIMLSRETDRSVFVWCHVSAHMSKVCYGMKCIYITVLVCSYTQCYILCWAQNIPTIQAASHLEASLHTSKWRLFSSAVCGLQMSTAVHVPTRLKLCGVFYCYLSIRVIIYYYYY